VSSPRPPSPARRAGVVVLALAALAPVASRLAAGQALPTADADVRAAVAAGDAGALRGALARGGHADQARKFGVSLLMQAAERGDRQVVDLLLGAGAPVGAVTSWNETALSFAVRSGDAAVVARVLAAGADVNHRARHGFTALAVAVGTGRLEVVERLLAAGADPNAEVEGGATPLLLAASQGRVAIARALVAAGARLEARDETGRDALAAAAEGGHEDAVAFLEQATGRKAVRRAAAQLGIAAAEIGDVDFRNFAYTLEGRTVAVSGGLHAAHDASDLALDSVSEVLGDLGDDGRREAVVLLEYRRPDGEARTEVVVFGLREGRLAELGRLPAGTAAGEALVGIGITGGRLRVERAAPGGTRRAELWRLDGTALVPAPAP